MIQFLNMQGVPFHFFSNDLNSEISSVVWIPLHYMLDINKQLTTIIIDIHYLLLTIYNANNNHKKICHF